MSEQAQATHPPAANKPFFSDKTSPAKMGKRDLELAAANMDVDINSPRPKRRRDAAPAVTKAESAEPATAKEEPSSDAEEEAAEPENTMTTAEIKEIGQKVLQLLKDAVDKQERQISTVFWKLPPKKQFPDYYEVIKRPVALDEVKTKVEREKYATLDEMQHDIETCFRNAKKYNVRDSVIWKDAKVLHKMANKEIARLSGRGDEELDSDGEVKKKEKTPNMHRMMKNRLQKLVETTDAEGRNLSTPFMDLPPRKKYADYYQLISKPICVEDIFKRAKRKEYTQVQQFIDDVNRMFDNAMVYNEEHSQIWEDALILKSTFRDIMKNLPAKYINDGTEPNAESSGPNKIKLRLPGHASQTATQDTSNGASALASGMMRIRVPVQSSAPSPAQNGTPSLHTKSSSPEVPTLPPVASSSSQILQTSSASVVYTATSTQATLPNLTAPKPTKPLPQTPNLAQKVQGQGQPSYIPPQTFYAPSPSQTPASISATPATPAASLPVTIGTHLGGASTPSPAPHPSAAGMYSARLELCPKSSPSSDHSARKRLATLTRNAGVRSFAVTVPRTGSKPEARIVIHGVKFASPLSSSGAAGDDAMDVDNPASEIISEATPSRKRGRGRPKKSHQGSSDAADSQQQENQAPAGDKEMESRMERETPVSVLLARYAKGGIGTNAWILPKDASEVAVRLDGKDISPLTIPAVSEADDEVVSEIASVLANQLNGNGLVGSNGSDGALNSFNLNGSTDLRNADSGSRPDDEWAVDVSGAGRHLLEIGRKDTSVLWQVYLYVV